MAVPTDYAWSVEALVAAHTALKNLIDTGSAGFIRLRDASDALLAQVPLTDPCGTVDTETGQFTITSSGPDTSADDDGTVAYGEICESDGTVHGVMPAVAGSSPASGRLVMNTLTVIAGLPVGIVSVTIG